jgi:ribosomal protein S18 acetylase RimI-like enzyme
MEIIPATEADIPELVDLWVEFFDYHRDVDPYYTRSEDARKHIEKRFREKIEDGDSRVLAAVEDGKVLGYSLFWIAEGSTFIRQRRYGFISDLAVTSDHRGRGIGDSLLERTLAWFETKKIERIIINVLVGNPKAIRFWERHGFEVREHCMERITEIADED